jgi:hypothetical protein
MHPEVIHERTRDVTCPAENASDSWNPLWFTG